MVNKKTSRIQTRSGGLCLICAKGLEKTNPEEIVTCEEISCPYIAHFICAETSENCHIVDDQVQWTCNLCITRKTQQSAGDENEENDEEATAGLDGTVIENSTLTQNALLNAAEITETGAVPKQIHVNCGLLSPDVGQFMMEEMEKMRKFQMEQSQLMLQLTAQLNELSTRGSIHGSATQESERFSAPPMNVRVNNATMRQSVNLGSPFTQQGVNTPRQPRQPSVNVSNNFEHFNANTSYQRNQMPFNRSMTEEIGARLQ
jgi:hypothetical protein